MKGDHLPYPPLSIAERAFIATAVVADEDISYASLAKELNARFSDYNRGCRTADGMVLYFRRMKKRAQTSNYYTSPAFS